MAIIPAGTKFHGLDSSVDTQDKGSSSRNALREAYTIEDIEETVQGGSFWEGSQVTLGSLVTSVWTPETTDANANAAIKPKGNGANVAQDPDGTATGGNARGEYATDWQKLRTNANEVAGANRSVIVGGQNNAIIPTTGVGGGHVIVGGNENRIGDSGGETFDSVIVGGFNNNMLTDQGNNNTMSGANNNINNLVYESTIIGGSSNTIQKGSNANAIGNFIGTGTGNTMSGYVSAIVAGRDNELNVGWNGGSFIGAGESNNVTQIKSSVVGGQSNTASGSRSFIGGGQSNTASNSYSTVGGGQNNTANGSYSTVGGGQNNTASGSSSFVAGANNTASGGYSSVGAGRFNTAGGDYSFVAGFQVDTSTSAPNSVCIGEAGRAKYKNAFVHSSGTFSGADRGAAQSIQLVSRSQADLTTGATTTLHLDGSSLNFEFSSNNAAANIRAEWVAVVDSITGTATGVSVGDVIAQDNLFLMKEVGGTASIVGSVTNTATKNDTSQASAAMGYSISSNELVITFTGATFSGGGTLTYRIVHRMLLVEAIF